MMFQRAPPPSLTYKVDDGRPRTKVGEQRGRLGGAHPLCAALNAATQGVAPCSVKPTAPRYLKPRLQGQAAKGEMDAWRDRCLRSLAVVQAWLIWCVVKRTKAQV